MAQRAEKRTVVLQSLGCKLNQAETESLARGFAREGYRLISPEEGADIYVLNTCTVTHIADRKSRHLLRSTHRHNPQAFIAVTGCYAERAPAELRCIEGVDLVVGNREKKRLVETLGQRFEPRAGEEPLPLRTRALVNIQEGCNEPCTFCIVPQVRGRERSRPREEVIAEVKARVREGYQEVTLTGTRIGAYEGGLEKLVKALLSQTEIRLLRLSSLQPQHLTPALLDLWQDERLCRHIHLPLQSGSESVLRRMGRRYSIAAYARAVAQARRTIPDLSLTADVIVGFPGESAEEFEESYRFCEEMGFAALHVFPYSARAGTAALHLPHPVPEKVKRERCQRMLLLAQRSASHFRRRFLGRTMMVLWETAKEDGLWRGLTDNYIRVFTESPAPLANRLLPVKLVAEHGLGLWGELR